MLKSHLEAIEATLLAKSRIPAGAGHPLHKGTPREVFVREFLETHLSEGVAIGTGEIIDSTSRPNEPRNQHDIVIFRRNYPKLDFGGGINGFLAESVLATISIKSTLTKADFGDSMRVARNVKLLKTGGPPGIYSGYLPPSILCFLVAYDGPVHMQTIHGWIKELETTDNIVYPNLPLGSSERAKIIAPALDAIMILGKGFLQFGNAPVGWVGDEHIQTNPLTKWAVADESSGGLLLLFILLTVASSGMASSTLNPAAYLSEWRLPPGIFYGF